MFVQYKVRWVSTTGRCPEASNP